MSDKSLGGCDHAHWVGRLTLVELRIWDQALQGPQVRILSPLLVETAPEITPGAASLEEQITGGRPPDPQIPNTV